MTPMIVPLETLRQQQQERVEETLRDLKEAGQKYGLGECLAIVNYNESVEKRWRETGWIG
jgi:hypothetical protein